jgi:hypothetical protein
VKPSRQEVYLTCSRTDADLSWPATVPGDNNGCSKGLRSNSVTGSLTPRQNQSPCRPHHHNRFIQLGAPREWELSYGHQRHREPLTGVVITAGDKTTKLSKPLAPKARATVRLPKMKGCTVSVAATFEDGGKSDTDAFNVCQEKLIRFTEP